MYLLKVHIKSIFRSLNIDCTRNNIMNKTYMPPKNTTYTWYLIDAKHQTLGRICTKIASTLKGKCNSSYTTHLINNVFIIVINAQHIKVSGQKKLKKIYYKHSGKPGSLKQENFEQLQKRMPNRIVEKSVKGMLPKNILGRHLFKHLKVYPDTLHPHRAQNPTVLSLN